MDQSPKPPLIPSIRDYGAVGDGVTDDAAAIQAAIDANGAETVFIPPGIYKIATGLINNNVLLIGSDSEPGADASVIQPTSAVGIAITLNGGGLKNLTIDGVHTSGKIGVLMGSSLASYFGIDAISIQTFAGAGGTGLKLRQVVGAFIRNSYINGCARNCWVSGAAGDGTPTTSLFLKCAFRSSTIDEGFFQDFGYQINLTDCVFENNKKEGLKILTTSTDNVLYGSLTNAWFEGNWVGAVSPTTHQQCVVDGTGGSGTIGLHLTNVYFNGSGSTAKALALNKVFFTTLSNVTVPTGGSTQILITNAAGEVTFTDNGGRIDFATAVSNSGGGFVNYVGSFIDTYFNLLGSADTTKVARFEVDGLTTATTRTWAIPDRSDTLAGLGTQTFTGNQSLNGGKLAVGGVVANFDAAYTNAFGVPNMSGIGPNNAAFPFVGLGTQAIVPGPHFIGAKTRANTTAPTTPVVLNDELAYFGAYGADATNYIEAGFWRFVCDGTVATNQMPTRAELYLTPAASATPLLVCTFSNDKTMTLAGAVVMADAKNITLGSSTGNKFGTATSQMLAFWNATPIIQPASANQAAVVSTAATNVAPWGFATQAQADALVTLVNQLRADLVSAGLIKGSA